MIIREYKIEDCKEVRQLFYDTVHYVNSRDYTKEQLNVWATEKIDLEKWNQSLLINFSIVAIKNGIIVGFGDIDKSGYLDRLYVHKEYQCQGIATVICNKLEDVFDVTKITTAASITAKSFFESRGYKIIKKQQVERDGILLENYIMEKDKYKN